MKYKSKYHKKSAKRFINYSVFKSNHYKPGDIVVNYAWHKDARSIKTTGSHERLCMVVEKSSAGYSLLNLKTGLMESWVTEDFIEMHKKGILWKRSSIFDRCPS